MDTLQVLVMVMVLAAGAVQGAIREGSRSAQAAADGEQDDNMGYSFDYAVTDPNTGDAKSQWETKQDGVVRGAYSLVDADGSVRSVSYTADGQNGFRAEVKVDRSHIPGAEPAMTIAKIPARPPALRPSPPPASHLVSTLPPSFSLHQSFAPAPAPTVTLHHSLAAPPSPNPLLHQGLLPTPPPSAALHPTPAFPYVPFPISPLASAPRVPVVRGKHRVPYQRPASHDVKRVTSAPAPAPAPAQDKAAKAPSQQTSTSSPKPTETPVTPSPPKETSGISAQKPGANSSAHRQPQVASQSQLLNRVPPETPKGSPPKTPNTQLIRELIHGHASSHMQLHGGLPFKISRFPSAVVNIGRPQVHDSEKLPSQVSQNNLVSDDNPPWVPVQPQAVHHGVPVQPQVVHHGVPVQPQVVHHGVPFLVPAFSGQHQLLASQVNLRNLVDQGRHPLTSQPFPFLQGNAAPKPHLPGTQVEVTRVPVLEQARLVSLVHPPVRLPLEVEAATARPAVPARDVSGRYHFLFGVNRRDRDNRDDRDDKDDRDDQDNQLDLNPTAGTS